MKVAKIAKENSDFVNKVDATMSFLTIQKDSQKVVEKLVKMDLQSKYSGMLPTLVDCQKKSQTTVGNGTKVKPAILSLKIFAVHVST